MEDRWDPSLLLDMEERASSLSALPALPTMSSSMTSSAAARTAHGGGSSRARRTMGRSESLSHVNMRRNRTLRRSSTLPPRTGPSHHGDAAADTQGLDFLMEPLDPYAGSRDDPSGLRNLRREEDAFAAQWDSMFEGDNLDGKADLSRSNTTSNGSSTALRGPPKANRFRRSHSITVMSSSRSSLVPPQLPTPPPPPRLPRRQRINSRTSSEGAVRSLQPDINASFDPENLNPNLQSPLQSLVSPKRSACDSDDMSRGAKKVRSSLEITQPLPSLDIKTRPHKTPSSSLVPSLSPLSETMHDASTDNHELNHENPNRTVNAAIDTAIDTITPMVTKSSKAKASQKWSAAFDGTFCEQGDGVYRPSLQLSSPDFQPSSAKKFGYACTSPFASPSLSLTSPGSYRQSTSFGTPGINGDEDEDFDQDSINISINTNGNNESNNDNDGGEDRDADGHHDDMSHGFDDEIDDGTDLDGRIRKLQDDATSRKSMNLFHPGSIGDGGGFHSHSRTDTLQQTTSTHAPIGDAHGAKHAMHHGPEAYEDGGPITSQHLLNSMTSSKDLKFLARSMRIASKQIGTDSWWIVPKSTWDKERRFKFMQWTESIGFSLRSSGGASPFLQISKRKGQLLLPVLEAAHQACKEGKARDHKQSNDGLHQGHTPLLRSAVPHRSVQRPTPMIISPAHHFSATKTPLYSATRNIAFDSSNHRQRNMSASRTPHGHRDDDPMTRDLVGKMKGLQMKDTPIPEQAEHNVASIPRPLMNATPRRGFPSISKAPSIDEDNFVFEYDDGHECSRPSLEHHTNSQDFMDHLHGHTPMRCRLSIGSTPGRPPLFGAGGGGGGGGASMPTPSARTPRGTFEPNSPHPSLRFQDPARKPQPMILGTPVVKCFDQSWGSKPINGRDWGASDACSDEIIAKLDESFTKALAEAGITEEDMTEDDQPMVFDDRPGTCQSAIDLCSDLDLEQNVIELPSLESMDDNVTPKEAQADASRDAEKPPRWMTKLEPWNASITPRPPKLPPRRQTNLGPPLVPGRPRVGSSIGHPAAAVAASVATPRLSMTTADSRRLRDRRQSSVAKRKRVSLVASMARRHLQSMGISQGLFADRSRANNNSKLPPTVLPTTQFFNKKAEQDENISKAVEDVFDQDRILRLIFQYLPSHDLIHTTSLVSTYWADTTTLVQADIAQQSVCDDYASSCRDVSEQDSDDEDDDESDDEDDSYCNSDSSDRCGSRVGSRRRLEPAKKWSDLTTTLPWACFLGEGGFKRVYKAFNRKTSCIEAVSVMDLDGIGCTKAVRAELAISVMLSSLVHRGLCPNFVRTYEIFGCSQEPPESSWGSSHNKYPNGRSYSPHAIANATAAAGAIMNTTPEDKQQQQQRQQGQQVGSGCEQFQYMRMELCNEGDAEEFLKRQPLEEIEGNQARQIVFQIAFALHTAAERFSLKHYDLKLLNVFMHRLPVKDQGDYVLRYGVGSHTFALRMPSQHGVIAKLADYGTANTDPSTVGQPVTLAQFTTLENSPPEFLMSGNKSYQGHGHDNFNIGLCMLHLFTGHAPYEEIMENVVCPTLLKRRLRQIWEKRTKSDYSIVREIIFSDVYEDSRGRIEEGERDEILYDTLYRYLVLFGVPDRAPGKTSSKVWNALVECLLTGKREGRTRANLANDSAIFECHRNEYSLSHGTNEHIRKARQKLEKLEGGMEVLVGLTSFDPTQRASALDVLNSKFMEPLREQVKGGQCYAPNDDVRSYSVAQIST